MLFSHSKTNSPLWHQVRDIPISHSGRKMKLWKRLKVHKTSEIVRENAYGIVSRARWVISALVSDLSLKARERFRTPASCWSHLLQADHTCFKLISPASSWSHLLPPASCWSHLLHAEHTCFMLISPASRWSHLLMLISPASCRRYRTVGRQLR